MPILTESDQEFYFPAVPLTGNALAGLLRKVQSYAESSVYGVGRKLESRTYADRVTLNATTRTITLPYFPVSEVTLVETRLAPNKTRYDSQPFYGETAFTELDADQYVLHTQTNGSTQIQLGSFSSSGSNFGVGYHPSLVNEVRVTYTAGFDFQAVDPETYMYQGEVDEIKSLLGSVVEILYLASANILPPDDSGSGGSSVTIGDLTIGGGIKRIEAEGQYEIEFYSDASESSQTKQEALTARGNYGENLAEYLKSELLPLKKYIALPNFSRGLI